MKSLRTEQGRDRGKTAFVAAFAIALCVCALLGTPRPAFAQQLTDDEVGVYRALFEEIYDASKDRPIVLSDQTARGIPPGMTVDVPTEGVQTARFLNQIAPETREDYEEKNKHSVRLPSPCHLAPACETMDIGELATMVKNARAWTKFMKKFSHTPGIVIVSRIGFNRDHTEAIVYTGYSCGTMCGQGYYAWMAKPESEWVVKDHTVVWISQK
jgi:hypothetical protein